MIGRLIADLGPSAENCRNSEGSFLELKDGSILFAWSRYGIGDGDDGDVCEIWGMISRDGGESFDGSRRLIAREDVSDDTDNIMSASLLRMKNGDIGLFFLAKNHENHRCRVYFARSADEGESWSAPLLCSVPEGYHVVNNDRVITTSAGRILVPAALHQSRYSKRDPNKITGVGPGSLVVYYSDDDGATFHASKPVTIPVSSGCRTGVQEPGLLELSPDRILCVIRTNSGRQYESFSEDGGETWTEPLPSKFTSAISPLSLRRLRDERVVAVWNPVPVYNGRSEWIGPEWLGGTWTGARNPLVMSFSTDNAENFPELITLEDDETRGFCYAAIHETRDGGLLLAYCAGGLGDRNCLRRLWIRKISRDEIK
ncbi:MAG: exo-alpha-sialidase [Clostridia bacterium]|nr:exo-alpha-sialidase [Clostridia bacterium]